MIFNNVKLAKIKVEWNEPIKYFFRNIELNSFIGKKISIHWSGEIFCVNCNKKIIKTFGEGFCYSCFIKIPQASPCIINPELCRAHLGEGRDIEWEIKYHLQEHIVYLSLTNEVKVGITSKNNKYTRWIDQGAIEAVVIAKTPNRYLAGLIEVELKKYYSDKTSWQKMLCLKDTNDNKLSCEYNKIFDILPNDLKKYFQNNEKIYSLKYPQMFYPEKIKGIRLEKTPVINNILSGIKGQYLIFHDSAVLNVRNHTGYVVNIRLDN